MTHSFYGRGGRFYRYYRCIRAIKSGSQACPARTLPGAEIERVVIDEIRSLGEDRGLLDQVLAETRTTVDEEGAKLRQERGELLASLNLSPREQARVLKLIFATVEYDANAATVAVTFRPTGIAALCRGKLKEVA